MTHGLVLAAATSPTEQAIFDELVEHGIQESELVQENIPAAENGLAHAWLVQEDDLAHEPVAGDYVLFYRGSNRYSWAARVRAVEHHSDLAGALADYVAGRSGHNTDPREESSDTVLFLDVPIPIELESYHLHDLVGVGQDALTRTFVPDADAVDNVVGDYGSLEELVRTTRTEPHVFFELRELGESSNKQSNGDVPLGTVVCSHDKTGDSVANDESLREPRVGDIVLHILKDKRELCGASLVASTLWTDFAEPDGARDADPDGGMSCLPLAAYTEFSEPIDIDADLLQNTEYSKRLESIYENNENLVYDSNFELAEDAYFTACPLELLYLVLAEKPALASMAFDWYWTIPQPSAAERYDSVNSAVVDVRTRLPFGEISRSWFVDALTETVVTAFTDSLEAVQPNAELTQTEATHCELLRQLYQARKSEFSEAANQLGVGPTNRVNEAETLFFVLFREVQSAVGTSKNMDHVKTKTILEENYKVETPTPDLEFEDESEPLEPADKPEQATEIARQLETVGQMVFYGPPGTGKTYTAKQFARWWLHQQGGDEPQKRQLDEVTFHPSFAYEDFIEGLKAETDDEGAVTYDEQPGVFLEIADKARRAYYAAPESEEPPRYVLIIDEINRGNLAQIFGEMITGLEMDKRLGARNESTPTLAHSGDPFAIPPNLYLIGTMNTADRSIALVDAALRRRFRFLSFPPKLRLLREEYELGDWDNVAETARKDVADQQLIAQSLIAVHLLNERIREVPDLGRGKQIGHSYFFDIETDQEIVDTWRFEILPLLEEYLFGQYDRIRETLFSGDGEELFDWEREQIKSFDRTELSTALEPFVEEFDPESITGAE
jgi:5-methylcytosine-specific restriction protein B